LTIISLFFILLASYYYIESLRGCDGPQAECLKNLNEGEVRELIWLLQKVSFILGLIITGILYKIISFVILFPIIISFGYLCFYYDTGSDLAHHGSYNRVVLFLLLILWLIIQNLSILIYKGLSTKTVLTIIILVSVIISGLMFYGIEIRTSCRDWTKGLKDTEIDQSNMPCQLSIPEMCFIDTFRNIFDYSGWFKDNSPL